MLINADFVNLATYDFQTPERDPKVADLPAPLQAMYEREPSHNVQYQVEYWLNQTVNRNHDKLNIGITSYGRSWVMSRNSGITGYPPIPEADGPAPAGRQVASAPGILSWPEICELLQQQPVDRETPHLRKVGDPTKKYGVYAYRAADDKGRMASGWATRIPQRRPTRQRSPEPMTWAEWPSTTCQWMISAVSAPAKSFPF